MSTDQLPSALRSFQLLGDVPDNWNAADLQQHLGGIPLQRICLIPPPGCASEDDVIRLRDVEHRFCELLDGILVEKTNAIELPRPPRDTQATRSSIRCPTFSRARSDMRLRSGSAQ